MRFIIAVISVFASFVLAGNDPDPTFDSIFKPSAGESITAGKTYTVEWQLQDKTPAGSVTIELVGGPDANGLQKIATLATGVDNKALKYDWAVDATLGDKPAYGLKILLESNPTVNWQWSPGFKIVGGVAASTTTTVTSSSATVTTTTAVTTPPTSSKSGADLTIQTTTTPAPGPSPNNTSPGTSPRPTSTPPAPGAASRMTSGALALVGALAVAVLCF